MRDWLSVAAKLAPIRHHHLLSSTFTSEVKEVLTLSNVWVIEPCEQGRKLNVDVNGTELVWIVDDFSHPFAHVLQSSSPMILDLEKLNYWQENTEFVSLVSRRRRGECVLILPLPPGEKHATTLCVLTGSYQQLSSLLCDLQWKTICEIFINQKRLINELGEDHRQISALSSSIKRIRSDEQRREKAAELKHQLIGDSVPMQKLRDSIAMAAQSSLNVMICGETGTGKELVARAVHDLSERSGEAFVAINCAAIPENLLESELFGYAKGAFSGADKSKQGLIADADKGTLFLDEIGDMPLTLQAKLLRVLESRSYRPVGASKEVSVDFRLVSATHVNMGERAETGQFRRDLFYRLNQFPLFAPALSERKEDIPLLSKHFISSYSDQSGRQIKGIRYAAIDLLNSHSFPGNVRELKNLIEYACAMTVEGDEITTENLSARVFQGASLPAANSDPSCSESFEGVDIEKISNLKAAVQKFEINIIKKRLSSYGGDRTKAAESLGLPKRTLAHKCLKMEIDT